MHPPARSRRTFLMQGAGAIAAAATVNLADVAHAAGSDVLKVGLVGCGGRGTGAAEQALTADANTKLVAMGDAFKDRLDDCLSTLKGSPVAARVEVPSDQCFVGFDAFKQVIDAVDVVLLATPPGFRPLHLAYAVDKGKHAFVEKPLAVDAPGLRAVLQAAEAAKTKGLSLVSGFCWRYHLPRRELMARVRDGAIGKVVAIETTYNSQGVWDPRKTRAEVASDMEYQMRNWYYYDWLSGDHIVEQAIHGLDTMGWAMGDEPPTRCWGSGGRQTRTDPKYGNIYDHFSIVYEYADGTRGYHNCRHWRGCDTQTKDYLLGAKGTADVFGGRITGEAPWRYRGISNPMYETEHVELFASIRSGAAKNDGLFASRSTLLGIMGRMAAYTGKVVTWEMAMNSQEGLVPAQFAWSDAPPERPVPRPGITKFA